jgi:ABC-2 type transport system ATP-binding protein
MKADGRTVLLTTHAMEEAQELADRVGIVESGRLVALGTPTELIRQYASALATEEAAQRQPNLEDVFLALTGHDLGDHRHTTMIDEEVQWMARIAP